MRISAVLVVLVVLVSCGGEPGDVPEPDPQDAAIGAALATWQLLGPSEHETLCSASDADISSVLSASDLFDGVDMDVAVDTIRDLC